MVQNRTKQKILSIPFMGNRYFVAYFVPVLTVFFCTVSVENKRMMEHTEIEHLSYHILNGLNPGIAKLHHFMAIRADQVIVLFVAV